MAKIVVLTGGPCGGKSTILKNAQAFLKEHNIPVIVLPEMASLLRDAGVSLAQKQPLHLQRAIAQTHLGMLRSAQLLAKENTLILCDRGLLDGKVYCSDEEFYASTGLTHQECLNLYDAVFHLESVATSGQGYVQTGRLESMEEAASLDAKLKKEWQGHIKRWVFPHGPSWDEKSAKVCEGLLSVAKNLEIERKWVLTDNSVLLNSDFQEFLGDPYGGESIQQYYLASKGRIRIVDDLYANYCIKNEKAPGIREELEEPISMGAAQALLAGAQGLKKVNKVRKTLPDQMPVVFDSISRPLTQPALHLVEAEYTSTLDRDTLPEIIAQFESYFVEVTDDPQFKNINLALEVGQV